MLGCWRPRAPSPPLRLLQVALMVYQTVHGELPSGAVIRQAAGGW